MLSLLMYMSVGHVMARFYGEHSSMWVAPDELSDMLPDSEDYQDRLRALKTHIKLKHKSAPPHCPDACFANRVYWGSMLSECHAHSVCNACRKAWLSSAMPLDQIELKYFSLESHFC